MKALSALLLIIPNLIWSSSDIMYVVDNICYSTSQEEFLECSDNINPYGYVKGGGYNMEAISRDDLIKMYQKCLNGHEKTCFYINKINRAKSLITNPNSYD